jgi:phosphoglucosamine mutase
MEASLAVREVVGQNEGNIIITPVGSTYVSEVLEEEKALFGGEPCGEYIYEKGVHVPDAMLAAAKFAELFCAKGKFSEQKKKYKQYFMAREKFKAANKYDAVEKIKKEITIEGKRSEEDGIRVDEDDGWFLIRASGTEPIVRLTMEYKSKERLETRKTELIELMKKYLG